MSTLKDLREQFSTPPEDARKAKALYNLKLKLSTLIKGRGNLEKLINDFSGRCKPVRAEVLERTAKLKDFIEAADQEIRVVKDEIARLEGGGEIREEAGLKKFEIGARFSFPTKSLERLFKITQNIKDTINNAGPSMGKFSQAIEEMAKLHSLTPAELEYIRSQIAPVPDLMRETDGRWAMRLPDHHNCRTKLEPVELVGSGESISKEDLDKFFESLPSTYRAPHMSPNEKRTREILTKLVKLKATDEMLGTGIERAKDAGDRFTQDLLTEQRRDVANDRRELEFDLSKMAQDIPIPNTKPERMGRVKDLQDELRNMESQMETLSKSMNQAIENEDEMYGGHLNKVVADIERKKFVIQDQLRRLEATDEEEVSFKGTIFGDW